ncbi:MAG TPA: hypothetical protein VFN61_15205, partial [Acidimicrobiales bacterium]|nr:hypothetical protein [Acidimicrobiales bacterium]
HDMLAEAPGGANAAGEAQVGPGDEAEPWSSGRGGSMGRGAPAPVGADGLPLLRRRRSSGVLTMEGRPVAPQDDEVGAGTAPPGGDQA